VLTVREVSSDEARLTGLWVAHEPFSELYQQPSAAALANAKRTTLELKADGTYSIKFFSDDSRSRLSLETLGVWRLSSQSVVLVPRRQVTKTAEDGEVVRAAIGDEIRLRVDTARQRLTPGADDTALGYLYFAREAATMPGRSK
jgi:hypothetical protein